MCSWCTDTAALSFLPELELKVRLAHEKREEKGRVPTNLEENDLEMLPAMTQVHTSMQFPLCTETWRKCVQVCQTVREQGPENC